MKSYSNEVVWKESQLLDGKKYRQIVPFDLSMIDDELHFHLCQFPLLLTHLKINFNFYQVSSQFFLPFKGSCLKLYNYCKLLVKDNAVKKLLFFKCLFSLWLDLNLIYPPPKKNSEIVPNSKI